MINKGLLHRHWINLYISPVSGSFYVNNRVSAYTISLIDIIEILGMHAVNVMSDKNDKDDFMPMD